MVASDVFPEHLYLQVNLRKCILQRLLVGLIFGDSITEHIGVVVGELKGQQVEVIQWDHTCLHYYRCAS